MSRPRFPLGQCVMTPGIEELILHDGLINGISSPAGLMERHQSGDWGDVDPFDAQANEDALKEDARIFSVYQLGDVQVWVITEADRSSTCVLLPGEY